MRSFDVIILGLGTMGSSAARVLARRGVRVLGLERFGVPHEMGSYGGSTRAIRTAYYEHPNYVPLLKRAYILWRELEADSKQELLRITGGLYMGRPDGELVAGSLRSATEHGLPHRMLERSEVRREHPQFTLPEDHIALFEEDAGYLYSERAVAASAASAIRAGADLRFFEPAIEWKSEGSGVRVTSARGSYSAQRLILCAGAWTEDLLRGAAAKLIVTRQPLAWFWPRNVDRFREGTLPFFAIENHEDGSLVYGFPLSDAPPGAKVAWHGRGTDAHPDTLDRQPRPKDEADLRTKLAPLVPDLADGALTSMRICMYTYSPDCHFIVDAHPDAPNVTIACGFSGHGFKFAPVIGELLADLSTTGRSNLPAEQFRLSRFGKC